MGPHPNDKKRFGQTMKKSSSSSSSSTAAGSRYQRQFGNNRGEGGNNHSRIAPSTTTTTLAETKAAEAAQRRRLRQEQGEEIDVLFGYPRLEDQYSSHMMAIHQNRNNGGSDRSGIMKPRRGWLFQMLATTVRLGLVLY